MRRGRRHDDADAHHPGAIDQSQRREQKRCPMSKLPAIERRRCDPPDEKLDFKERGRINIIKMHDGK
jgi:hypothetical protein